MSTFKSGPINFMASTSTAVHNNQMKCGSSYLLCIHVPAFIHNIQSSSEKLRY